MTMVQQKAIEAIKKMPDDQVIYLMQIIQGMNGFIHTGQSDRMDAFRELESMLKKGTVTDDHAELSSYRDEKYGL